LRTYELNSTLETMAQSAARSPAPMALFDGEGRLVAASRRWRRLTRLSGRNRLGMSYAQLFPEGPAKRLELHRKALAGQHLVNQEEAYREADGETRWLSCEYRPVRGPDGSVGAYFVHGHDITPLMCARAEAQAYAERLKLALRAARAGVCELDLEARTIWCSPEFDQIVGVEVTDFRRFARDPWWMAHPDDKPLIRRVIADWTGPRHEPTDFRILLPSGETYWVQIHGEQQLDAQGRRTKIVGLILDIDARKRQELALVEAERAAQAAAEAKSQFLANMSHEIRTPMNGVLGVLHLLKDEQLSDQGRRLLAEAANCGRMLSQLLDDVIDLSRIEAGRLELAPEPTDPRELLEGVADLLRPNAEAKGLELRVRAQGDLDRVMADPVRLRQALFNLVGNAVKFTATGHVEARLTASRCGQRRRLRFEVEDTGVGIPEAAQASLFRRFQQADGSTSRRFGGSGLGLAITRRLVQLMDGQVGFESREGSGSTFWLEISPPRAQRTPRPPRPRQSPESPPLAGLKVLLVEDNPTNRLVGSKILEALQLQVAIAEDGAEGVEAARTGGYDLILMDVQMPVMDGVEATRQIRRMPGETGRTPIIGLTANAMSHQREQYLAAGMDGVASKPISPSALIEEIGRVLNAGRVGDDLDAGAAA
jgi:PAS domain S-box-containing protein